MYLYVCENTYPCKLRRHTLLPVTAGKRKGDTFETRRSTVSKKKMERSTERELLL